MSQNKQMSPLDNSSTLTKKPLRKKLKSNPSCQNVTREIEMVDFIEEHKWLLETYDFEGNNMGDVHLFLSKNNLPYNDMGLVENVIESISTKGKPCFEIISKTMVDSTCTHFYLPLECYQIIDMEPSKQGKIDSFAALGWPNKTFNSILDEGLIEMDILVQGFILAKEKN